MPKRQQFIIWKREVEGINLSHGVGTGRSNLVGDVMLVQALLNFIVDGNRDASKVGLPSADKLPDVTGHWDAFLDQAIISFQRAHERILRREPLGQISPVSDKFDLLDEEEWPAILLLNQFAEDATGLIRNEIAEATEGKDSGFPYPQSLCKAFPQLRIHLTGTSAPVK